MCISHHAPNSISYGLKALTSDQKLSSIVSKKIGVKSPHNIESRGIFHDSLAKQAIEKINTWDYIKLRRF